MNTTQSKFYCNTKALTPEERSHHKQLGDKLMAAKKAIVETDKGYEFQFGPQDVTLADLADIRRRHFSMAYFRFPRATIWWQPITTSR